MTLQSHFWAYTLRKLQFKKTHVALCSLQRYLQQPGHRSNLVKKKKKKKKQPRCPSTDEWINKLWCVHAKLLGCVQLFVTHWTVVCQAPLFMGVSRQEYWSELSCPSRGDLSDPQTEPVSLMSPALAGRFFTTGITWEALWYIYTIKYYSATKRNEFESVAVSWINLEPVIQSEVSQKEKYKYRILTYIWNPEKQYW